jgi:hypothetical protein
MPRLSPVLAAVLVACQPSQVAQTCPTPEGTAPPALAVTQVLLRRGSDLIPSVADYTLSLTASGDALYVGSPTVPVPGEYMGRIGAAGFQRIVTDLFARGLTLEANLLEPRPGEPCTPQPLISIVVQTADGQYSGTSFCGRSDAESRLASPIYSAIEQIRWYPGNRSLALRLPE